MRHHDERGVVVPADPAAPFVMVQSKFFFQLLIVLLNPPATLCQSHQAAECVAHGQIAKEVLGRLFLRLRPLHQQPYFFMRRLTTNEAVRRPCRWLWNRFTVHYTPKHGSWLNQAEIAISLFSRQCLGKRRIGDRASLRKETRAWNRRMNRDRVTIQWSFTRKQARKKLGYKNTRSRY